MDIPKHRQPNNGNEGQDQKSSLLDKVASKLETPVTRRAVGIAALTFAAYLIYESISQNEQPIPSQKSTSSTLSRNELTTEQRESLFEHGENIAKAIDYIELAVKENPQFGGALTFIDDGKGEYRLGRGREGNGVIIYNFDTGRDFQAPSLAVHGQFDAHGDLKQIDGFSLSPGITKLNKAGIPLDDVIEVHVSLLGTDANPGAISISSLSASEAANRIREGIPERFAAKEAPDSPEEYLRLLESVELIMDTSFGEDWRK